MPEAAVATPGGGAAPAASAAPPASAPSAGATLVSVPQGAGAEWASSFKDENVRTTVSRFKTPEDLATSYYNLEKMKGVPEDRLLKLPEKLEGPEARAIFERLGAPKDPKGYELPRDQKDMDPKFTEFAESMFFEQGITKAQAQGIVGKYSEYAQKQMLDQVTARNNSIIQADEKLKGEWGAAYEKNINIVKQGVHILGLDAKTLDFLEAAQGRETLYKTLHKIGVGVGESSFVDGSASAPAKPTQEQAQEQLKQLTGDEKFRKKLLKGDVEARKQWDEVNQLAAPGEKQIG